MTSVLYDVPGPRARRRQRIGGTLGTLAVLAICAAAVWKLASEGQFEGKLWEPFTDPAYLEALARGLGATIRAAALAIVLALVFGALFATARLSERAWVRLPATTVIEFFRAVPLLLLILFLYLGFAESFEAFGDALDDAVPATVSGILGAEDMDVLGPLVIGLMLYNGAVLAEVFRAGILAVSRGQAEAAYSVGLRKSQVMRLILVPQAVRIMLPAIVSQCVVALKDTSLGFVIAYYELVQTGKGIYTANFNIIPTALVVAAIYISLNMSVSYLAVWLERRQSRRYGRQAVTQAEAAVDVA
ncbi:MAG: amino acid ABC transporter permease [Actinomycetes bacterium]